MPEKKGYTVYRRIRAGGENFWPIKEDTSVYTDSKSPVKSFGVTPGNEGGLSTAAKEAAEYVGARDGELLLVLAPGEGDGIGMFRVIRNGIQVTRHDA